MSCDPIFCNKIYCASTNHARFQCDDNYKCRSYSTRRNPTKNAMMTMTLPFLTKATRRSSKLMTLDNFFPHYSHPPYHNPLPTLTVSPQQTLTVSTKYNQTRLSIHGPTIRSSEKSAKAKALRNMWSIPEWFLPESGARRQILSLRTPSAQGGV